MHLLSNQISVVQRQQNSETSSQGITQSSSMRLGVLLLTAVQAFTSSSSSSQQSDESSSNLSALSFNYFKYYRLINIISRQIEQYNLNLMIGYLLFLSLLGFAWGYTQENGVVVLTETDFTLAVKEHQYLFVKFYTPWCGHCKKIAPIFVELATELKATHPNIRLAEVDLDQHKSIQTLLKIQSFPTLILFKNGQAINFGGSRTKQFMLQWLSKKINDAIITIDQSQVAALKTDGNVNIVYFGDIQSAGGKNLLKIAEGDDYNMYYRVDSSKEVVEMYRPFGQPVTTKTIDYNIRSWIYLYDRPFVLPYDDRTSKELFTEKRSGIFLFASTSEESGTTAFKQAAEEWKVKQKKRLIFTQIEASDESFTGLSDYIKVNPAIHPIVYIKNAEKLKYVLKTALKDLTAAKVIDFIKLVESGKIKKYKLDEQTRPKAAQPTPSAQL